MEFEFSCWDGPGSWSSTCCAKSLERRSSLLTRGYEIAKPMPPNMTPKSNSINGSFTKSVSGGHAITAARLTKTPNTRLPRERPARILPESVAFFNRQVSPDAMIAPDIVKMAHRHIAAFSSANSSATAISTIARQ